MKITVDTPYHIQEKFLYFSAYNSDYLIILPVSNEDTITLARKKRGGICYTKFHDILGIPSLLNSPILYLSPNQRELLTIHLISYILFDDLPSTPSKPI
jgi:hypothetical protein